MDETQKPGGVCETNTMGIYPHRDTELEAQLGPCASSFIHPGLLFSPITVQLLHVL